MALTIQTDLTPLRVDEHGVIRVGDSQVLPDIVKREAIHALCPNGRRKRRVK